MKHGMRLRSDKMGVGNVIGIERSCLLRGGGDNWHSMDVDVFFVLCTWASGVPTAGGRFRTPVYPLGLSSSCSSCCRGLCTQGGSMTSRDGTCHSSIGPSSVFRACMAIWLTPKKESESYLCMKLESIGTFPPSCPGLRRGSISPRDGTRRVLLMARSLCL